MIRLINFDELGKLNRQINILKYAETTDEYGLTHQTMQNVLGGPIWAYIEPARGRTYYEQYRDKTEILTKIVIRYRPGIDESMVVEHRGRHYRIQSVVDPYEQHARLELMCSMKERGADDNDAG